MRVAIGDVDPIASETAAEALGGSSLGMALAVSDPSSFAAYLDETERRLGPLDVLINNAGIHQAGAFVEEPPAVTQQLIAVNIAGTIEGSRLALERFVPRGRGHDVNVASVGGLIPVPYQTTYSATKHAVVGFHSSTASGTARHRDPHNAGLPRAHRPRSRNGSPTSW